VHQAFLNGQNSDMGSSLKVGFIFRAKLTSEEQIDFSQSGRIPQRLCGYLSGRENPEPGPVGDWLRKIKMPASEEYVPMFVYAGIRPKALSDVHTGGWEQEFELNPVSVIPSLMVVCRTDIQNAAFQKKPATWFWDLSKMRTSNEKIQALLKAASQASPYAEARMHRPLKCDDFL
jgi:hypothetical protein